MSPLDLKGIFPALPTPLDPNGSPDLAALTDLIEYNLSAGVSGFVPMGGTGEYTALSNADRISVVRHTVETVNGRVPVIPGVLATGFSDAIAVGQSFKDVGASAIMLVTPFYVVPSQQGVIDYFNAYRDTVDAPLLYYDIPARTGFVSAIETFQHLAERRTIVGAKVCNTDAHYFNRLSQAVGDKIALLSGDDTLYAMHVMHGATGGVLASAPLLPKFWVELHETLKREEYSKGIELHRKMLPVFAALFNEVNPGPLKTMVSRLGHPMGHVSLPLASPGEGTLNLIESAIDLIKRERMI